ncbi:hypothetical protein AAG570_000443 [Ranatra chinensis]|uniref:Uncharacterized protein n=1 Tax=Ranatra chinensis TaxID=642074 RepID=A0ABD0ZI95_9HEMI
MSYVVYFNTQGTKEVHVHWSAGCNFGRDGKSRKPIGTTEEILQRDVQTSLVARTKLLERQKSSSQRVAEWGRVSALGKDNESSLAEEMESTLREVTRLVEDLETAHKARVFRRNHEGISSLEKYRSREKEFQESVEIGLGIMKKITDAVGVKLAEGGAQKGKPGKIELHATGKGSSAVAFLRVIINSTFRKMYREHKRNEESPNYLPRSYKLLK